MGPAPGTLLVLVFSCADGIVFVSIVLAVGTQVVFPLSNLSG